MSGHWVFSLTGWASLGLITMILGPIHLQHVETKPTDSNFSRILRSEAKLAIRSCQANCYARAGQQHDVVGLFLCPRLDCTYRTMAQWFWGRRVGTSSTETHLKPACAQAKILGKDLGHVPTIRNTVTKTLWQEKHNTSG